MRDIHKFFLESKACAGWKLQPCSQCGIVHPSSCDIVKDPEWIKDQKVYELAQKFQEYLDDSGQESDNFIEGMDVTFSQAVELFNDFLLFLNEGDEVLRKVKDPTEGKG
jgi:hypothetical protein